MATAANAKKVYALAASTAPGSSDEIDGISECTVNESRDMLEVRRCCSRRYSRRPEGEEPHERVQVAA